MMSSYISSMAEKTLDHEGNGSICKKPSSHVLSLQETKGPIFPTRAKCSVLFKGMSAEALLHLPSAPTQKALTDIAPAVWVTVGKIQTDSLVLQVATSPLSSSFLPTVSITWQRMRSW